MFKGPIIVVDDDQSYLDQLNLAFSRAGMPCLPVLFERNDPDNETGIDHISCEAENARVIALDINLRESSNTDDAKSLYPTIEKVLEKINPRGPYYLIFWSRYKNLPEHIFELLRARSKGKFTPPIGWGYFDKTDAGYDESLKNKILEEIRKECVFDMLTQWEGRTGDAASRVVSELYQIASGPNDNGWEIKKTIEKLKILLTHIAHESVGHKNSKDIASHAIEAGLFPILEDKLLEMTADGGDSKLDKDWKECLEQLGDRNQLGSLGDEDVASLNCFYNLEEVSDKYSKCKRGVFVTLPEDIISDDKSFKSLFGNENTYKNLVTEEFLFNTNVGNKKFRDEARKKLVLGWLEIGALCDHAHRKNRLHRYLLSALVPAEYMEMICAIKEKGMTRRAHEGIYRSPLILYKKEQYVLLVSFRYTAGLHNGSDILDKPIFRLKEQIISEIAFAWSKHAIRPGITSFANG